MKITTCLKTWLPLTLLLGLAVPSSGQTGVRGLLLTPYGPQQVTIVGDQLTVSPAPSTWSVLETPIYADAISEHSVWFGCGFPADLCEADLTTGTLLNRVVLNRAGGLPSLLEIAVNAMRQAWGVDARTLYRIDLTTGEITTLATLSDGFFIDVVWRDGSLWAIAGCPSSSQREQCLIEFDEGTGATRNVLPLGLISSVIGFESAASVDFDAEGQFWLSVWGATGPVLPTGFVGRYDLSQPSEPVDQYAVPDALSGSSFAIFSPAPTPADIPTLGHAALLALTALLLLAAVATIRRQRA